MSRPRHRPVPGVLQDQRLHFALAQIGARNDAGSMGVNASCAAARINRLRLRTIDAVDRHDDRSIFALVGGALQESFPWYSAIHRVDQL